MGTIALVISIFSLFVNFRLQMAYNLKLYVLEKYSILCTKLIKEGILKDEEGLNALSEKFPNKHSLFSMVFSFRPLRIEYWYTEEEVKELIRG